MESTYIGQSQDIYSRLRYHYYASISNNLNRKKGLLYSYAEKTSFNSDITATGKALPYLYKSNIKKTEGLKNMLFNINLSFPNFIDLYLSAKGEKVILFLGAVRTEFRYILQSFNEFLLGVYEQALISFYRPKLNTLQLVNFNFLN